jgi:hypothetical protein
MFLRLLKQIFRNNIGNHFFDFIEMMLCINIDPNPEKRISIKKTHDNIVTYLNDHINDMWEFQNLVNIIEKDKANIKNAIKKQIKHDEAVSYKMSLFQ